MPPAGSFCPSIVDVLDALDSSSSISMTLNLSMLSGNRIPWTGWPARPRPRNSGISHRPTYFEAGDAPAQGAARDLRGRCAAWLLAVSAGRGVSCRFVTVCAQFGEVVNSDGYSRSRNAAGQFAGRARDFHSRPAGDGPRQGWRGFAACAAIWLGSGPVRPGGRGFLTAKRHVADLKAHTGRIPAPWPNDTSDYRYESGSPANRFQDPSRLTRIAAPQIHV